VIAADGRIGFDREWPCAGRRIARNDACPRRPCGILTLPVSNDPCRSSPFYAENIGRSFFLFVVK
jgi:hypothetical protein